MPVENQIFQRRKIHPERLAGFGFTRGKDGFLYQEPIMNGQFRAEIFIGDDQAVRGRVVDVDSGEEFLPLRVEAQTGAFTGEIREAYAAILRRIADACTTALPFLHTQANRLAERIEQIFGDKPDYPFAKLPAYGVFRHPGSKKWYALVMNIPRKRLLNKKNLRQPDSSDIVEIMNVKADPVQRDALIREKGVYPCYHMNRDTWITLLLEEELPDKRVLELMAASRAAAAGQADSCGHVWLVPANPSFFDIEAAFAREKSILWKQSSAIRQGDVVYMYLAAPVSAIRFRCEALETDIPYAYKDAHVSMSRVMRLRLTHRLAPELFPMAVLKSYGVAAVRGPRHMPGALLDALEKAIRSAPAMP